MISKYAAQLSSVLLRKNDLFPPFFALSDEEAGVLMKSLCRFLNGENVELQDQRMRIIFESMATKMDRSARRFVVNHELAN